MMIEKNILVDRIILLLENAKKQAVYAVNQTMVLAYFEIGRMIVEEEQEGKERADYGKHLLKTISTRLTSEFGKGFSEDNLGNMRKFYQVYSNKNSISETMFRKSVKQQTLSGELQKETAHTFRLSWSHYLKLMRMDDNEERTFYEIETATNNWSVRELQRQFDSGLYQRLCLSRNKEEILQLAQKGQIIETAKDAIKDPYILEFIGLPTENTYSEATLETALIDKLEHFLNELGKGFMFVKRQQRISIDEKHFYIDLVFYNRLLRAFVLIDLKIGELKHQDLGQMQMYVNYYDRFVRLEEEQKTIGIVLCRDKSKTLVEITLPENNQQIFASKYQTVLPSKEEWKNILNEKEPHK